MPLLYYYTLICIQNSPQLMIIKIKMFELKNNLHTNIAGNQSMVSLLEHTVFCY